MFTQVTQVTQVTLRAVYPKTMLKRSGKIKIKMDCRFFRHLEDAGHIPRGFSRAEWEDLAYR